MTDTRYETATLGGGCFWCVEAPLKELRGIISVESGYAGGHTRNPTYEQVCSGTTGHAEVVQVVFDPAQISYRDLLTVFFTLHDPTTLNRQGADRGTQYRSVIFYHSPEQHATATELIAELERERTWDDPVITEVLPLPDYYRAESYHQDYFAKNPRQPYCVVAVAPKVAKVRKAFMSRLAR